MRKLNLDGVEEQKEYSRLEPGAYIARITLVEDISDKEYLKIEYDIAEGKFKDYYKELFIAKNFWGGKFIRSYKETAMSFFKSFITAIEKSNGNYKFNEDKYIELKGKLLGIVLSEEEYIDKNGTIKERLYVSQTRSIDEIKKGNISPAPLKKLKDSNKSVVESLKDIDVDDLPF